MRWKVARHLVFGCMYLQVVGCIAIPGSSGTTHYVVIGFGVVSVNEPETAAAVATHLNSLGVTVSDRPGLKFGMGWVDSTVVSVAENAEDVRIEVARYPGGPLTIDCPSAKTAKDKTDSDGDSSGG